MIPPVDRPVLVVNLGWEQARLIALLSKGGQSLVGVHYDDNITQASLFSDILVCDLRDLPKITRFAERHRPIAVVSDQCDYSLFATATIANRLGLPGVSLGAAQRGTNKFLMREAVKATGLPQPEYRLCFDEETARHAADEIGYPVIVKPVDNRGSFGVNVAEMPADLAAAVSDAIVNANSRLFLVEQYIDGSQIIVEGYSTPGSGHRSLAIGWKTLSRIGSRQIADVIAFPCDLADAKSKRILVHNDKVAAALGYRCGATSGEYRIDSNGDLQLLEMANRGGGVMIASHIVPLVSGFDITRALIRDALGSAVDAAPVDHERDCVQMHYLRFPEGKVTAIEGLDAAAYAPGVVALRWYGLSPGDTIRSPSNDAERQGMLIARGPSVEAAARNARAAAELISVRYA